MQLQQILNINIHRMKPFYNSIIALAVIILFPCSKIFAQNEQDAVMMGKRNLCISGTYAHSNWIDYWEGTFNRSNQNMGRVSTRTTMLMLNYGVSDKLNLMVSLPHVATNASAGTLHGLSGWQDLGFYAKYRPIKKFFGKQRLSLLVVAGYTMPSNDYNIDFLPMSIGMGSKVATGRIIADYQYNGLFASVSTSYQVKGNVQIDRPAYYTTQQINSNEVKMPNSGNSQLRLGYRNQLVIAEGFVDYMKTFGGFDIRRNDMPFVSNEMNSTTIGVEGKFYIKELPELGVHTSVWHTVDGRNVGQSSGFMAGLLYTLKFSKPSTSRQ